MIFLAKAVGILLTPPALLVVLAFLGLLVQRRYRRIGTALVTASLGLLAILSLPATGLRLMEAIESRVLPLANAAALRTRADAIVILGGGRNHAAPEYGGDTVSGAALERLRYGAHLQRLSGLPLLVTGGSVYGEPVSEGELMQRVLIEDFKIRAAWVEDRSRTTNENALYSRAILEKTGIRRVALVTQPWHMPRAVWAFEQAGFEVVPAPTGYSNTKERLTPLHWLPSARGLMLSSRAVQETIGLLWYQLAHSNVVPRADRQEATR